MATLKRPDGSKIFYKVIGKKSDRPPLVLVHGWCSRHEIWEQQVRHFRKDHQIVVLDRRGHGRSSTSGSGHTATSHAADIKAVTQAAGRKRVVAVGHAGGSPGTLEFIRANRKLVRAGILVDTYLYPKPKPGDASNPFGALVEGEIQKLSGPKKKAAFRTWYTSFFDKKGDRAAIREIVAEAAKTPDDVKIAELRGMLVDTAATADGINQPILWLTADMANQTYISQHLKNVSFAQVYGAGHFPQSEQPAQTNAMIEAFLARL